MNRKTRVRNTFFLLGTILMFCVPQLTLLPHAASREDRFYSIQSGTFRQLPQALSTVKTLRKRGFLAFYREEKVREKGTRYVVYVGRYPSREEARQGAKDLKEKGLISAFLIRETTDFEGEQKSIAEPEERGLTIEEIAFRKEGHDKETVMIRADRSFTPVTFPIEGEHLRLVIDIKNSKPYAQGLSKISAGGQFVEKIRTFFHAETKTQRVVLDLSSSMSYKIRQLFFKKDNTFVVIIERKGQQP